MIDDELYRRVKAKAAMEGRKVTELVEDGPVCGPPSVSARRDPASPTVPSELHSR